MFTLLPVTVDDLSWLFELHKAALKVYIEPIWGWDEAWQRDYFYGTFNLEDSYLIALTGKPIGRLTVTEESEHIFLAYIALLTAYQNRGIGSEVIRRVMEKARSKGKPLVLTVLRSNPVKALYERLGFTTTESGEIRSKLVYGQQLDEQP